MNTRSQLLCAWGGPAFVVVFTVGLWFVAHYLPPPSPTAGAQEIAALYRENTSQIRLGMFLMMACSALIAPFVAAIAVQMKRMETGTPVLTYAQLSSGTVGILFFILPAMIWTTAAFRPERDAELILLLNDLGWILFLMPFTSFVVQNIAIGTAILANKSEQQPFPRWTGYFNFWVAVLFVPGGLLTFFKTGPFAWNGLFVFWVPLVVFFLWYGVMFVLLRKAIMQQAASAQVLSATGRR
ncbi:MAG: hypothetical protein ACSLE5_00555 [Porticoccaceae bacterium]